jgi:alpha-glucosidase (family GH31 glycosyl hydrolase)
MHTGRVFDGGQVVTVDAPLAVIPVFARDDTHPELMGFI